MIGYKDLGHEIDMMVQYSYELYHRDSTGSLSTPIEREKASPGQIRELQSVTQQSVTPSQEAVPNQRASKVGHSSTSRTPIVPTPS